MDDSAVSRHPLRSLEILLVEDSPSDALLTQEALKRQQLPVTVHHVADGMVAMQFLNRQGDYADAPVPDLVLLDINMPRKNGHEVLHDIRSSETLRHLSVIMLTTSDDEHDVLKAYSMNANCYIKKPADMTSFVEAMTSLEDFWMKWVVFPVKK